MNNEFQNVDMNNLMPQAPINEPIQSSMQEPKKHNAWKYILTGFLCLCIGAAVGGFVIYSMTKENNNPKEETTEVITDKKDYKAPVDTLTYLTSKEGYNYYYYTEEDGTNVYYYSYGDRGQSEILEYYATDADGHYKKETYNDYVEPIMYTMGDYINKQSSYELFADDIDPNNITFVYMVNEDYAPGVIYYQYPKAGVKISEYDKPVIVVNEEQ